MAVDNLPRTTARMGQGGREVEQEDLSTPLPNLAVPDVLVPPGSVITVIADRSGWGSSGEDVGRDASFRRPGVPPRPTPKGMRMEEGVLFFGQLALLLAGVLCCVDFVALIVSVLVYAVRKVRQMYEL